jgi:hypothetical protein
MKTTYTGPVKNRGVNAEGKANVSREELEDFKRQYGQDKTLRDLLNADKTGKTPASEKSPMARGPQGANVAPRRAEIPSGGGAKAPADTGMGGMSDTTRNVLTTLGALGVGGGAAGLGARALMRREAAKRAAEAEKLASRVTPTMRRSGEGVDEAMKQARIEMAREPQMERARALSAAERKAPAMQGDKAKTSPRARTRDVDEDVEFRRGGKVKTYAKGGSVRGSGCETRHKKTKYV